MSKENTIHQPLPIGTEDFAKLRTRGCYYIDKTHLIRDLLHDLAEVTLFTRPRRFGKTLNMSMLRWFFEIPEEALNRNDDWLALHADPRDFTRELFSGLCIEKETELCRLHMGKYPVISISLKGVAGPTFEDALECLKDEIAAEAMRFTFLADSPRLTSQEHAIYNKLIEPSPDPGKNFAMSYSVTLNSLKTLTSLLSKHYGKNVVLLIDEYDVPLDQAHLAGYYNQMVDLIRGLFHAALKTNPSLAFAVLTGCLRISKESIFTGMNNLRVDCITDSQFNSCFGFTDAEVRELLQSYEITSLYDQVKTWYDGYNFAGQNIYCPWDVIRYCANVITGGSTQPQNYWVNTSGNDIVRELIETAVPQTKADIESLIAGETVSRALSSEITYRELNSSPDNIFSVLFFTGYLTASGIHQDEESTDWYDLVIPNQEIRILFKRKIREWFSDSVRRNRGQSQAFYRAMLEKNTDEMERILNLIMSDAISIRDTDTKDEFKENFYHGMVLGLLYDRALVRSNRESGIGYSDLLIRDAASRTGIVLEFKYVKKYTDLESGCDEALSQIRDLSYETALRQEGMKTILCYVITFWKKICMVRLQK